MAMQTEWLVPLAQPRQKKQRCELCLGPATVRCAACLVTYYCDVDHQNADWISTAQNFLLEGHHEDAIPAALHSLKFSISIYGPDSAELVPAYLALAETSLGLGHLSQGEEYLSQAQWIVLKNPHCSYNIQSKLHRNLGLLYAARGNFDDSLYHLANDVVNLWHDHFSHFIGIQYQKLITPAEVDLLSVEDGREEDVLDEKQRAEAMEMLNSILHFREQSLRPQPEKEAKLLHTLAMFHFLIHDLAKADEFVMRFLQTVKALPTRDPGESLYHLVKLIKSREEQRK
ncbi:hypothetical protein Chor_005537 [Crotalus horridus]